MSAELEACPLCAQPFGASVIRTNDELFGRAFGGRVRVSSCKRCNNRVGHEVEGRLHTGDSLLSFARAAAGLPGKPLKGKIRATGDHVDLDFQGPDPVIRRPQIEYKETGDLLIIKARGTSGQLPSLWKSLRKGFGALIPTWEQFLALGNREEESPAWVEVSLALDSRTANRFVARVGLLAGALVWGTSFIGLPFAQNLRQVLWSEDSCNPPLAVDPQYPSIVASLAESNFRSVLPDFSVPEQGEPRVSQIVLAPLRSRRRPPQVPLFLHILNFPVVPFGVVVNGAIPDADVLPVVVREPLGFPLAVWKIEELLLNSLPTSDCEGEESGLT